MSAIINKEKLPSEVGQKFIPYLEKMIDLHGANLVSVFIYGSATGQNYVPKVSDINSVFIFSDLKFDALQKSLRLVNKGIPQKIAAPLFLTEQYIKTSLDVFPIEFLDMKENHLVVYGQDILPNLEIKGEHIRLFCEQEIKGKLIRIRQAYLEVGLKRKGIEALLKESLNALIPIFRNLIRLKKETPAIEKSQIITQLCAHFDLKSEVFLSIYKDSTNDEKINGQNVEVFLEKYIDQINLLAQKVDQL